MLRHLRPGLPLTEDVTQGIAAQSALSSLGMLAQGLVRFVFTALVTWGLGVAVVGVANTSIAAALLGSLLVPIAAATAASKHLGRLRGSGDVTAIRSVLAYLGRLSWGASLLVGVAAAAYAWLHLRVGAIPALLTGLLAIAYSGYTFTRGTLLGLGLLTRATVWDLVSSTVAVIGVALLVAAHASPWLLAPLATGYALYALASAAPLTAEPLDAEIRRDATAFLRLSLVQTIATSGFLQASQLAAQGWGTPTTTGYYAIAMALATPASLVSRSLQTVLFPRMAHAHGRGDLAGLARQTDLASRWLIVVSVAVYGCLALVAPLLLRLAFGEHGRSAAPVLVVLLVASLVQNMVVATTDNLMSREARWNRVVRDTAVIGAAIGVGIWLLLGPRVGVIGVAWGYLAGTAFSSITPAIIVWRLDGMRWRGLATRFLTALTLLAAGATWLVHTDAAWWAQLCAAGVFLCAWAAASRRDVRMLLGERSAVG